MRLLVVGRLSGQLATAVKMAMAHGAKVSHVERGDQATEQLRRGQGADLMMVDYRIDIAALIAANDAERIHVPVVACGVDADAKEAADAIRARLTSLPRGGNPADARSICHPLVVGNLVSRALNAAAAVGWPKVDAQVIAGC